MLGLDLGARFLRGGDLRPVGRGARAPRRGARRRRRRRACSTPPPSSRERLVEASGLPARAHRRRPSSACPAWSSAASGADLARREHPRARGPGGGRRAASAQLGMAVTVENDVNLAALGERWRGVARGVEDFAFLSIGTGLGAGLVLRRRAAPRPPRRRRRGRLRARGGPRARHRPVRRRAARLRRAPAAEGRRADRARRAPFDVPAIFAAARAGDALARAVVDEEARRIALHIAPIAAVADVGLVVIGGGIGANGDLLLEPVRALLARGCPTRRASRSRPRRRRGAERRAGGGPARRARGRLREPARLALA